MKIQFLATVAGLCSIGSALAFSIPSVASTPRRMALHGQRNDWISPVTTAALGWALASQLAGATVFDHKAISAVENNLASSSSLVAVENLDYKLPSYEAMGKATGGFGEGTEARLGISDSMVDPGANEKAKQGEAMRRAEETRLAQKEAKKKLREQQYEAELKKQELKKAESAKRFKEIFN